MKENEDILIRDFILQNLKLEFVSAGDCHGDLWKLKKFIMDCLSEENLSLVIAGGDYQRQPAWKYGEARKNVQDALATLKTCPTRVLVLGGNYELLGVTAQVSSEIGEPLFSIGSTIVKEEGRYPGNYLSFKNFHFIGVEGSNPINGQFPGERSEEDIMWAINKVVNRMGKYHPERTILVTHVPPYNSGKRDQLGVFGLPSSYWGKHVGSTALKKFVSARKPLLHVCGHVHEGVGVTIYFFEGEENDDIRVEDISMTEYEKVAVIFNKGEKKRVTICANHGTLEHWTYFRYRIAENENYVGVEVSKRRLGGMDILSKFSRRLMKKTIYNKVFYVGLNPKELKR
jgi:Icc-related predicted phosphoesterase